MGPVKTRLLLQRFRRRQELTPEQVVKIDQLLRSPTGVALFGEELAICGAIGDGTILQRLKDIFDWMIDNQDEIMALIEMVLEIIALFT